MKIEVLREQSLYVARIEYLLGRLANLDDATEFLIRLLGLSARQNEMCVVLDAHGRSLGNQTHTRL